MEGPAEPGLEEAEDGVAPWQDLWGVGAIGALDLPIVTNALRGEGEVGCEAVRADGGATEIDPGSDEGIQILLEPHALEHGEPRPARTVRPLLDGHGHDALVQHLSATPPSPLVAPT